MAVQLVPTQMTPRHIAWTAMMGMHRSQSILGMPSVFMYSRPAQESNHRKIVNHRSCALVGCRVGTSDILITSSSPGIQPGTHTGSGISVRPRHFMVVHEAGCRIQGYVSSSLIRPG